ncbi:MAG: signal peptidase II [Clostridia bacterium]|nr:signal peptidase II [Clostridia bacterium]
MTVYIYIILLVCVLDQLTKLYAMDVIAAANNLAAGEITAGLTKPVIKDVLHLTYIENSGMSFGLLSEHRLVFMVLSTVGIAVLFAYLVYLKGEDRLLSVSLSLMIGGGIGNMFDRIILGYVVDFVDFCYFDFWKWIFNFADTCICIGAALMLIAVLASYIKEKNNA